MLFKRRKAQRREISIGLDLGSSQIKVAVLQHHGEGLQLSEFGVKQFAASPAKTGSDQQLAEQIQQLMSSLSATDRRVSVSISCSSAMVCQTEFPRMPMEEVKSALKLNSTRYLRRDFSNYCLDAIELVDEKVDGKAKKNGQMKVLVGGASKEEVAWYKSALAIAKIRPDVLELSALTVINAFRVGVPEVCEKEVVLLADIGARCTSLSFLREGQPQITRIMHFGGAQVSEYVAQMLTLDLTQAEEEKLKMSEPVQALVRTAISPLAREIRSSIDFFERQHECRVARAFACGGSACSPSLMESLSEEVGMRVECWNPVEQFDTSHLNGERPRLMALAPSLAAAVGTAAGRL